MRARSMMVVASLCVILALVLSACGSSGGSTGGSAGGSTEGGGSAEAPSAATFGMPSKISSLDPDLSLESANDALHFIGGNLFEEIEGEIVPGLAAKKPQVSQDELTWTIELKPNLKFSDGSPLTSADVVATFERSRTDKNNINAFVWEAIESVDAQGPKEVSIHLSRPYPSLERILSKFNTPIFPADKIATKGFFDAPISAGPYKLVSWGGGNTAVLEINPNFWGSPPSISKITMRTVPDSNTRLSQVKSGQLQLGYALPPNLLPQITPPAVKQAQELYGLTMLSMQTTKSPLDELGVRKAISEAIDREQMAEIAWGGETEALKQVWPRTMAAHDSSIPIEQDIPAAEKALVGTACEGGCSLSLTYSAEAYPFQETEAPIVKSNLEEVGIKVSLDNVDTATYYEKAFNSDFELFMTGLYASADVPDEICPLGFYPTLQTNFTEFDLASGAKACEEAVSTSGLTRLEHMREASEYLMKDVPWTPLVGFGNVSASSVPESVVKVLKSTLIGVVHENGKVW